MDEELTNYYEQIEMDPINFTESERIKYNYHMDMNEPVVLANTLCMLYINISI